MRRRDQIRYRRFVSFTVASLFTLGMLEPTASTDRVLCKKKDTPNELPTCLGRWTLDRSHRIAITPKNIFAYMNGAAENYLGYRFVKLEVNRYTAEGQPLISVELFTMGSADDAFGLLSRDWRGEAVLSQKTKKRRFENVAFFESSVLRMAVGTQFVRIELGKPSESARAAALELGRALMKNRRTSLPPTLANRLPSSLGQWALDESTVTFFRSPQVLNATHFVSPQNILLLDHSVSAVSAIYQRTQADRQQRFHAVRIRYPTTGAALQAAASFRRSYLTGSAIPPDRRVFQTEQGWSGLKAAGPIITLVLHCPDAKTADDGIAGLAEKLF